MSVKRILVRREGGDRRSFSPLHFRRSFGKAIYNNRVVFAIDGQATFGIMYDMIERAKKSVYIVGYDLDPSLSLIRNDGSLSKYGVKGRQALSSFISNSVTQHYNVKPRYRTLQRLIIDKAKQGVRMKIIIWQPRLPLRILPGADERGLDGRAGEVEVLNKLARKYGIDQNLQVKIDSTSPTLSSAHHEKIIIIDNKYGFCGGFDLSRGKWDTSRHNYNDLHRDQDSEPWHDVHSIIEGPVVWDLAYHFRQRWAYHKIKDGTKVRSITHKPTKFPNQSNNDNTRIVALRTWEGMDRSGGILAWYANSIKRAKLSIYIENQFPFQNEFITKILCKRLKEQKRLKVIIVGPLKPNLPGLVGSILSRTSVNDVNEHLRWLRDAGDSGKRVCTYSLISQDQATKKVRQTYVHSKIMIVDDKWITIGSANTDKNGFKDSTEFNLGITSRSLATQLRTRLWCEHLGWLGIAGKGSSKKSPFQIDPSYIPQISWENVTFPTNINYSDIEDFGSGFDIMKKFADHNGISMRSNGSIKGHLYYHNFEELNIPPPFPEANGANRFKFL